MTATTLTLSALATFAAATAFAAVAVCQSRRDVPPRAATPLRLFVLWWLGLAVSAAATGGGALAAALGMASPELVGALRFAAVYALAVALWGLMYYLSWVLTGRSRLLVPLALLYAAYYAIASFSLLATAPGSVDAGAWYADLAFASEWGPRGIGALVMLEVPPLVGALVFLSVSPHLEEPGRRRRVALGAAAILAWCASGLALRLDAEAGLAGVVGLALGLAAAAMALRAHGLGCARPRAVG
jgi:hypothetical protein